MTSQVTLVILFCHILSTRAVIMPDSGVIFNESGYPTTTRLFLPMITTTKEVNPVIIPHPYPKAQAALSRSSFVSFFQPEIDTLLEDVRAGIQHVFQTQSNWTLALHGTGTTGIHAILDNLLEPGDKVVVLVYGYWGQMMANMSERIGAEVIQLTRPVGTRFTLEEIEEALETYRPTALALCVGESSTGVHQPIEGIGELCEKYNVLLICDMILIAGIQPLLMDQYKIDAVAANSHKGLGGFVGLAPVAFSDKAVKKILSRRTKPRAYQTDIKLQMYHWNFTDHSRGRKQSISVPLIAALREALATLIEEGLENVYKRHESTTTKLRYGLEAMGMRDIVTDPQDRLIGIVTTYPPPGKDARKIVSLMYSRHNVEMSSGLGPTFGKILRFTIIGSSAYENRVDDILQALKEVLSSFN